MPDLPSLLNAPWAQPLAGLLVTALGSWLGSRKPSAGGGITQTATTHGTNSPVTQTVNQNTWHITPTPSAAAPATRTGATSSSPASSDDEAASVILFGLAAVVGVAAVTWAVAVNWSLFTLGLRAVTLLALFVTALTWWRWPHGVRGAWCLRILITGIGSAVLWALTVLPVPVGREPSLVAIQRMTAGMNVTDSIAATIRALSMEGLLTYELRLAGLLFLLLMLYVTTSRGLGAVIAESGAQRKSPSHSLIRLGNRLMGSSTMGVGYFLGAVLASAAAVALIHPFTVGRLLELIYSTASGLTP